MIVEGYCQCGCGQQTTIYTYGNRRLGIIKGKPVRFAQGHHSTRLSRQWPIEVVPAPTWLNPSLGHCWLWIHSRHKDGYGWVGDWETRKGAELVHRRLYRLYIGEIPEGHELDHLCRRRPCINYFHLEAVRHSVNMRRSPLSTKLSDDDVRTVRDILSVDSKGGALSRLARQYGVTPTTIYDIFHNRTRRELN